MVHEAVTTCYVLYLDPATVVYETINSVLSFLLYQYLSCIYAPYDVSVCVCPQDLGAYSKLRG